MSFLKKWWLVIVLVLAVGAYFWHTMFRAPNAADVKAFYQKYLKRPASAEESAAWLASAQKNGLNLKDLELQISTSQEAIQKAGG